jgi:asparagine synthase (glutamine-hydrolysing)
MCGIAGILDPKGRPIAAGELEAMLQRIKHRGPDDDGRYFAEPPHAVALGQTRLAIVDLSPAGRQPMPNEDGSVVMVCNGEIYNHKDLRLSLRGDHRFRGQCDVEVLLHLYEEQGDEFLPAVNGMFALALWDRDQGRLLLARDRFGVKPLYWALAGGRLIFASEIKAILVARGVTARIDPVALAEHFTWQWTTGERTWFDGIHLLEPGAKLVFSMKSGLHGPTRYHTWRYEEKGGRTEKQWRDDLLECFTSAVNRQLMSDVPLGTYLSGGMDTGSISAVASKHIPDLHTFTCGFDCPVRAPEDVGLDEREASWDLARRLRTQHHEFLLTPYHLEAALDRLVWHLDYPTVGISYQVYHLAQFVRGFVTVVLSGTGGDELFAGYPWRYEPILDCSPENFTERYYRLWTRFFDDGQKRKLFRDDFNQLWQGYSTAERFADLVKESAGCAPLHRALAFDAQTFLQGLLQVEDKLTMAHALESRVPFLDNELLELLLQMPANLKAVNGVSKLILKKAMTALLPEEALNRRKQGFTPPEQSWFRGPNRGLLLRLLTGPESRLHLYCRPEAVQQILREFETRQGNHRQLIWSLMLLERWHRLFIEQMPLAA